jgi:hypothetical protein
MNINKLHKELLEDFAFYSDGDTKSLLIDTSKSCGEGHVLHLPNKSTIESASGIIILNRLGEVIVDNGWFEFVIDAETKEEYFFWQYLRGTSINNVTSAKIPDHIWNKLSNLSKELLESQNYDDQSIRNYELKLKDKKIFINDWRLMKQESYLANQKYIWKEWVTNNPKWDHDHCEFCGVKFGNLVGDEKYGYTTKDDYYWVCKTCFEDFKVMFQFSIDQDL